VAEPKLANLDGLRQTLPEPAKDMKLNLATVLSGDVLSPQQTWGVALSAAYFLRDARLRDAVLADARENGIGPDVVEDAQAAASLMGMNTVYYRFRHMVGKPGYETKKALLRMQWMAKPKTPRVDFELFSLACAALAGCQACIQSHEAAVVNGGLSEDHVHETVRIAAVVQGFSVALGLG
jgi:lipoyl-dependent peroxiredoxin subunit D